MLKEIIFTKRFINIVYTGYQANYDPRTFTQSIILMTKNWPSLSFSYRCICYFSRVTSLWPWNCLNFFLNPLFFDIINYIRIETCSSKLIFLQIIPCPTWLHCRAKILSWWHICHVYFLFPPKVLVKKQSNKYNNQNNFPVHTFFTCTSKKN